MTPRILRIIPLLLLLVVTGCRTYGGYGTETILHEQMQQANRQFSDDLQRAQADLATLKAAADTSEMLQPMVERFQRNIDQHETTLDRHRQITEDLAESGDYRALHRAYGTITTEQRMMRKTYNRTVERVRAVVTGTSVASGEAFNQSFYFVQPFEYTAEENARRLTMEQALRAG
jgi:hypothetical protein